MPYLWLYYVICLVGFIIVIVGLSIICIFLMCALYIRLPCVSPRVPSACGAPCPGQKHKYKIQKKRIWDLAVPPSLYGDMRERINIYIYIYKYPLDIPSRDTHSAYPDMFFNLYFTFQLRIYILTGLGWLG